MLGCQQPGLASGLRSLRRLRASHVSQASSMASTTEAERFKAKSASASSSSRSLRRVGARPLTELTCHATERWLGLLKTYFAWALLKDSIRSKSPLCPGRMDSCQPLTSRRAPWLHLHVKGHRSHLDGPGPGRHKPKYLRDHPSCATIPARHVHPCPTRSHLLGVPGRGAEGPAQRKRRCEASPPASADPPKPLSPEQTRTSLEQALEPLPALAVPASPKSPKFDACKTSTARP